MSAPYERALVSLTGVGWEQVRMIAPWTLVCVTLGLSGARYLDVLLLSEVYLSMFVLGLLSLYLASKMFTRESVIFRN